MEFITGESAFEIDKNGDRVGFVSSQMENATLSIKDNLLRVSDGQSISALTLLVALCLTVLELSAANPRSVPAYYLMNWQVENGLPQNTVHNIAQTADGYLWLATPQALALFDGQVFRTFTQRESAGPDFSRITCLYGDRSGRLWIGSHDRLYSYSRGRFTHFPAPEGMNPGEVKDLCQNRDGQLYALFADGLFRIEFGRLVLVPTADQNAPKGGTVIAADPSNRIWVAWGNTLYRYEDDQWSTEAQFPRIVNSVTVDYEGTLWCGLNAGLVASLRPGSPPELQSLGSGSVFGVILSRQGEVLFRVSDSLIRYPGGESVPLVLANNESIERIQKVFQDREANFWVGTIGKGLVLLRRQPLASYSTERGLKHPHATTIEEDHEGTVWVGTLGGGLARFQNGFFRSVEFTPFSHLGSLRATRDGRLWVGTYGHHLWRIDQEKPEIETRSRALAGRSLFEDNQGRIWIGGDGMGAERLSEGTTTRLDTGSGLMSDHTRCFAQDSSGAIWIGTDKGLHRFENDRIETFTVEEGLGGNRIQALFVDSTGCLWIGTGSGGLTRYRQGEFRTIRTEHGLLDNSVAQILEDNSGHLWLGTSRGLFRTKREAIHAVLDGAANRLTGRAFGKAEGMPNLECTGGFQPNCLQATDGSLWFATVDGVITLDPSTIPSNTVAPPIHIDQFLADGAPLGHRGPQLRNLGAELSIRIPESKSFELDLNSASSGFRVPAGTKRLEFHFTGISFTAPEGVQYRYRLAGYDRDWNEAGGLSVAAYTRVAPGDYTFEVQAANSDGVWNPKPAALQFVVHPEFWQTWWFQIGAILGATGIAFSLSYGPIQRRRQMARLRLRIARDLHDEVGSNLGTISLYNQLAMAKTDSASPATAEFQEIDRAVQQTVQSLRDVVWFIDPEFDTIGGMLQQMEETANRALAEKRVAFVADAPPHTRRLALDFRRNVFSIFREVTHNILKHSQAQRVTISISFNKGILKARISDDGVGFDTVAAGKGHGFKNMRRRAAELGGTWEITSNSGHGTTIQLEVPLT